MTQLQSLPPAHELFHSHSDMTRKVEEIEAHATALFRTSPICREIFSDLVGFAREFAEEVTEHIAEEEEVFPIYEYLLSPQTRLMLNRVYQQHRELEGSLAILLEHLDVAEEDVIDNELVERIYIRARQIRYAFTLHSIQEREFLEEVAAALARDP